MTDQEKENVINILRMAKGYVAEAKKDVVERCDFDASLRIASNEARVERYFASQGIEQKP